MGGIIAALRAVNRINQLLAPIINAENLNSANTMEFKFPAVAEMQKNLNNISGGSIAATPAAPSLAYQSAEDFARKIRGINGGNVFSKMAFEGVEINGINVADVNFASASAAFKNSVNAAVYGKTKTSPGILGRAKKADPNAFKGTTSGVLKVIDSVYGREAAIAQMNDFNQRGILVSKNQLPNLPKPHPLNPVGGTNSVFGETNIFEDRLGFPALNFARNIMTSAVSAVSGGIGNAVSGIDYLSKNGASIFNAFWTVKERISRIKAFSEQREKALEAYKNKNSAGGYLPLQNSPEYSAEELGIWRDIAEREAVNRFTTAEVIVNLGGVTNNVSSGMDLDGIVSYLSDGVAQALMTVAEGV